MIKKEHLSTFLLSFVIGLIFAFMVPLAYAEEVVLDEPVIEENLELSANSTTPTVQEITENYEYLLEVETPLGVYNVNYDEFNPSDTTAVINHGIFPGAINPQVLDFWASLVNGDYAKKYVAYRADRYKYILVFSDDLKADAIGVGAGRTGFRIYTKTGNRIEIDTTGGMFRYQIIDNTYGQMHNPGYTIDITTDANSQDNNSFVYTNLEECRGYMPALNVEGRAAYEDATIIVLFALLMFSVLRWIFIRR